MTDDKPSRRPQLLNGPIAIRDCRYGNRFMYYTTDEYVGRSLELYGEFSDGEVELFKHVIRDGNTVLDVGANIGYFSVLFASMVGRAGLVYAFEPQRQLYQMLCGNLAINLLHNVRPYCAAAAEKPGKIMVPWLDATVGANFGGIALGSWTTGEYVSSLPLDGIDMGPIQFVKVDVEGMEIEALTGMAHQIATHRPILFVENDRAENSKELLALLEGLDYKCWWHITPLYHKTNFAQKYEDVFKDVVSINLVCYPNERAAEIANVPYSQCRMFRLVDGVDDDWKTHWGDPFKR